MKKRQANDTIKGYFYQFNKTIYEILSQNNKTAKIVVEGIEDIDIKTDNTCSTIQCKYYSKQTYNHSVIKEAIIYMFRHFSNNKSSNLRYKIYANFKDGQSKLPSSMQLKFFKDNFLTYKEKGIIHKVYEELNADMKVFLSRIDEWVRRKLRVIIWKQWKKIRKRYTCLRKLGVSHRDAYVTANARRGYYHIAHTRVLETAISKERLNKRGLVNSLDHYIKVHITTN